MDKLKKIAKKIVDITNEGSNDYDIYDDVLEVLEKELPKKPKGKVVVKEPSKN